MHGVIEKYGNIKKTKHFLELTQDICQPDEVTQDKIILEFNFQNVRLPYESYKGDYASVKYYIKIIIALTVKNTEYEKEFAVVNPHNSTILEKNDEPIKMQVGMKNKLSLAIYFQHKNYSCRGTLKGFIAFNYLNINLKFMEVQIVRREIIFGDKKCEPAYVARYELIDGVPNKNEKIPIRFFLKSYNLTPTYPNIDNVFFVKYYLNLVIADDQDNRYFKQKEICLFRLFKEKRNVYNNNNNNNNQNNYNYINEYGEFEDNDEIFITEPIYEEDFFTDSKEIQNYNEEDDNMNMSFYSDIKGMNAILPSKRNNIQEQKKEEYKQDNYNLLVMYMNNNFQNNGKESSERNNYDDFENMSNNNKKNIKINNNKNKKINNINNNSFNNNNSQFNRNKPNNNYNKSNINKVNKPKNEIIINNNTSNYHSIKTDNTHNSYDENNMFEDEEEEMNLTNKKVNNTNNNIININNNINNINNNNNIIINENNSNYNEIKTNYKDINMNSNSNYRDDFNRNENIINNINNEEDYMNNNQKENKKEVHHSHRSNLMQARISTEDDFNDILNSLDTNTNNKKKDELKKNIFG